MTEPRLHNVQCLDARGLHRMAYWEWGDASNPHVVVCAHGLSRQGRDFDTLATRLCDRVRVVCPDVVGRGRSDWLDDPMGYSIPHYIADMVSLLARLNAAQVDWVGTSMGGLIGLGVAALKGSPLRRLVLNDVGPAIEFAALERIGQYLGQPVRYASLDEAADRMWAVSQGFGPHTREQWLALSRAQIVEEGGVWRPRCDPAIAQPYRLLTRELAQAGSNLLWQAYDSLRLPTLLLRGAQSDLLSPQTAAEMTQRGPQARLVEFDGVGHAPTLMATDQVRTVEEFLQAP